MHAATKHLVHVRWVHTLTYNVRRPGVVTRHAFDARTFDTSFSPVRCTFFRMRGRSTVAPACGLSALALPTQSDHTGANARRKPCPLLSAFLSLTLYS